MQNHGPEDFRDSLAVALAPRIELGLYKAKDSSSNSAALLFKRSIGKDAKTSKVGDRRLVLINQECAGATPAQLL